MIEALWPWISFIMFGLCLTFLLLFVQAVAEMARDPSLTFGQAFQRALGRLWRVFRR
jgi:hypothetical protein